MRDLVVVQGAHGAPRLLEIIVADLLRRQIAETCRDRVVVGEKGGVRSDLTGEQEARDGCVGCLGGVGHECRVVELATHVEGTSTRLIA